MNTLDTLKSFVILEELAKGGMGAVHVGYNPKARRLVAIKTLFKAQGKDPRYVERFRWEGDIYKRLSHPNIIAFVDMDEVDGINFIAIEHVRGKPLDALLKQKQRFPWEEATRVAGALGDAMAHYHERGLIHRDIKPQNVLLNEDGIVKLIDFGIAVSSEQAAKPDGSIVGTFNYSSPEQNQGRKLDERSDLYSLGLMYYEMLTGKRVFPQSSLNEVCGAQLKADIPFPSAVESDVPKGVDGIVMKLIAKDANARYQKAKELLADLELLKEDPNGFDPRSAFDDEGVTAKWEQAKAALAKKDYDQALRLATVVQSRKPDSAEVLVFLGKAHAGAGNVEEVQSAFKRAMELEPDNDQHRLDYGIALYTLRLFSEAAEAFQHILDLVPDNPYAKRYLGLCEQASKAPPPQPGNNTPVGGIATSPISSPGAVKPVPVTSPGQVKTAPPVGTVKPAKAQSQTTAAPVSASLGASRASYLWWGAAAFGQGKPAKGLVLSVVELANVALIALPFSPPGHALLVGTGALASLFAPGGPLHSAALFREWALAGPAILLFVILELVLPPRSSSSTQAPPTTKGTV